MRAPVRGGGRALAAALALAASPGLAAGPAPEAPPPADGAVAPHGSGAPEDPKALRVDVRDFQVVKNDSGPINYYTVVADADGEYLHGSYVPPMETTVLAWTMPDRLRRSAARVRWRWRAAILPVGGNECVSGKNDSAAVVYLTFKRGFRWYALKYVWSTVGPWRATCDQRRNLVNAQDTIVAETGGPVGVWRTVEVDPLAEFRRHFDAGRSGAEAPEFMGIGVMSDGDQTQSPSAADFGGFVVTLR
ncbi:DUF3047 domain-containing protein [Anaeromyxobacter diazotrophicus]|uniref:DUF3047 domain-containing protein n=1 Tax=Anaeromyxobacter diazotrophicus TaxID=2590199 RepID=UPI001591EB1D|nr:DUF3047 domain-containing protein [Anaeromyxobacter diazotrophicus]